MIEVWKSVPGYDGRYEASNIGRVRSLWAAGNGYARFRQEPLYLIPKLNRKTGYMQLQLSLDGLKTQYGLHRIICLAFHGFPKDPSFEAAHLNGKKIDNREDNLIWASHQTNESHKEIHGTISRGDDHYGAVLSTGDVIQLRQIFTGKKGQLKALSQQYGFARQTIAQAIYGDRWSHITDPAPLTPRYARKK